VVLSMLVSLMDRCVRLYVRIRSKIRRVFLPRQDLSRLFLRSLASVLRGRTTAIACSPYRLCDASGAPWVRSREGTCCAAVWPPPRLASPDPRRPGRRPLMRHPAPCKVPRYHVNVVSRHAVLVVGVEGVGQPAQGLCRADPSPLTTREPPLVGRERPMRAGNALINALSRQPLDVGVGGASHDVLRLLSTLILVGGTDSFLTEIAEVRRAPARCRR